MRGRCVCPLQGEQGTRSRQRALGFYKSAEIEEEGHARGKAGGPPWKDALERLEHGSSTAPFSAYASILRGCCDAKALPHGRRAHSLLISRGLERDHYLGNLLLLLYCKCGALHDSYALFCRAPHDLNVFSWAIIIGACAHHGHLQMAVQLFEHMHSGGIMPDKATFVIILSVCASAGTLPQGMRTHTRFLHSGLEADVIAETALVNMYSSCGNLVMARRIFDSMHVRNVVSWTAMISAYSRCGYGRDALILFQKMRTAGVVPNQVTYVSLVDACACDESFIEGKLMHSCIVEREFNTDLVMGNALVTMYSECGSLADAWVVFDKMIDRDIVTWTAIVTAYAHHGCCQDALWLFEQMQLEGFVPDRVTFISMLDACASDAVLTEGKKIHLRIVCSALVLDFVLGTALMNMYGKCGKPDHAGRIFDNMPEWNLVTWNAIIASYAQHGEAKKVLQLFDRMQLDGVTPDIVTFSSILSVCSHAGLVEEGCRYALKMHRDYGYQPTVEHYNCMIGLLGRVGLVKEGEGLMKNMPVQPTASSWVALLGSCKAHLDLGGGKHAAEHVFELNSERESPYIVLSNLCSAADKLADVANGTNY